MKTLASDQWQMIRAMEQQGECKEEKFDLLGGCSFKRTFHLILNGQTDRVSSAQINSKYQSCTICSRENSTNICCLTVISTKHNTAWSPFCSTFIAAFDNNLILQEFLSTCYILFQPSRPHLSPTLMNPNFPAANVTSASQICVETSADLHLALTAE